MELVVRATVIYFFLWAVTRGVGKRELSQLTAFELVLLVVMGDLIQQGATQDDRSLTGAIIVVSTMTVWIMLFSWIAFRSKRASRVVDGVPVVVVRDGRVLDDVLRLERVGFDEVLQGARSQGIDDLAKVRVAVLETDGKFSFVTNDGGGGQQGGDQGESAAT